MTKDELLKLVDAGFTASEIRLMAQAEERKTEPAPAPEPKVEPAPAPEPEAPKADPVLAAIEKLTGAVQSMNLRYSAQAGLEPAQTADDVLRAVYYPDGGIKRG